MKYIPIIIAMVLFLPLVCAAQEPEINETLSEEALGVRKELNLSEQELQDMIRNELNIISYNDTLTLAKQSYEAQIAFARSGGKSDFSIVNQKINELKDIKENAFIALDEIKALEFLINQTTDIPLEPVLEIYNKAKEAFDSERYEESLDLIDDTYEKISELEAFETKLKAFYDATSGGLIDFLKEKWMILSITLIAIIIGGTLAYNWLVIFIIKTKLNHLEIRRNSIKDLIAKTQRGYFEKGEVSETTYQTRIRKYGEMIRDINRQIPILNEHLKMKIKRRKKDKDSVENKVFKKLKEGYKKF